ncbi:mitochondrial carrier domain-containing protein [Flammula alnicola]|nr:mitochondrial carrier domain-containing protein [Flammula alnicola]
MTSTLPPLVQAFSGAIGSASANALAYPLNLVTTRLQLDSPRRSQVRGGIPGALRILKHIFTKHGMGAFYDGLWADTCATLLSNFFYFYFYTFLRRLSVKRLIPFPGRTSRKLGRHKPSLIEDLVLGLIAGVMSRAVSTPLNIVTLRIQTEREVDEEELGSDNTEPLGIADVVKLIYKEQGLKGFWRGFQTSALLSLNPAMTLGFFQMYRRILILANSSPSPQHGLSSTLYLHPREAFLGAAISSSIAVTILYPLILGKKRLQTSSSATIGDVLLDAYQGKDVEPKRRGSVDSRLDSLCSEEEAGGLKGLYQGYQMKIITGFLSQGVTFLVKGRIEQLIVSAYLRRHKIGSR